MVTQCVSAWVISLRINGSIHKADGPVQMRLL
jgi:hypothetical protein